jgi:hypothetical protein
MKAKPLFLILALVMPLVIPVAAFAASGDIPVEYLSAPVREWQLNLTTLYVVAHLLGNAYSALKHGGGLVGIFRGILFGENVPAAVAKDYEKPKPPSP